VAFSSASSVGRFAEWPLRGTTSSGQGERFVGAGLVLHAPDIHVNRAGAGKSPREPGANWGDCCGIAPNRAESNKSSQVSRIIAGPVITVSRAWCCATHAEPVRIQAVTFGTPAPESAFVNPREVSYLRSTAARPASPPATASSHPRRPLLGLSGGSSGCSSRIAVPL
jgi:hypothetical protein